MFISLTYEERLPKSFIHHEELQKENYSQGYHKPYKDTIKASVKSFNIPKRQTDLSDFLEEMCILVPQIERKKGAAYNFGL